MCHVGFDVLDKRDDLMYILPRYIDFLGLLANAIRLGNLYLHFTILICFIFRCFISLFVYL
jgi:hypothetical protein